MRGPTADNLTLTAEDVRVEAHERLAESLPLAADGYRVSTELLVDVLLHAAATGTSVEAACDSLLDAADANTVRAYLNDQLRVEDLPDLEDRLNEALAVDLPRKVRRGGLDLAADTHDQPFYGKSPALLALAMRGEAKSGTTHFFRIATVYVMLDGMRLTLAVWFVRPGDELDDILSLVLHRVQRRGLRIRRLWLDRGFASVPVFDCLRQAGIPAVIACPIRGKTGWTRALCQGPRSYIAVHAFHRPGIGYRHVSVAVVRVRPEGQRPLRWMVFALIGVKMTPYQVRDAYRRLFGIESSYRQMRQVRIKTNSRNGALRFVYLAVALLLVNIWCLLRFRYCQIPRRGRSGRPVDTQIFKLRHLASFLRLAIERCRGVHLSIHATVLLRLAESVVH